MLSKDGCLARRKRLWAAVPAEVEWLLVADPRHVHYLANFWVEPLSFSGGERGLLLLERDGTVTLLADNFAFRSSATEPYIDREVLDTWYDHRHSVRNRDQSLFSALNAISGKLRGRPGLVESEWLPAAAVSILELDRSALVADESSLGTHLRNLRRCKEPDEIDLLRRCMRATEAGHVRAREVLRAGVSELDIFREVQSAANAAAGRACVIYGDFRATTATKPKAGGLPTEYRLAAGDFFILDYSVVICGYRSDFTNTLCVGNPTDEQQMQFGLCEAAMRGGEAVLKAGIKARDVYAAVSEPLEKSGYGPLKHHAGHGIGLAHPEPPILVPESDDVLEAGNVITLEPGLYVEGIGGIRIEHNYLITDRGFERLSQHLISLT